MINFGDINKVSRRFTAKIDHPPSFWPREAPKTTKKCQFLGSKTIFP